MNLRMPALQAALEEGGVTKVKSGNVVFSGRRTSDREEGRSYDREEGRQAIRVVVRRVEELQALIEAEPHQAFRLPAGSKQVVTFLREEP